LRRYMWSSFRAYAGLAEKPKWLECEKILELGGAKKTDRHRIYRDYVETAVREGLAQSPWEHLQEQIVLGGAEFLEGLREFAKGDPREQHGVRQFAVKRPKLQEIIANAERLQGRSWNEIRDRHGDPGRDLVLFAGRHFCGLTLRELAEAAGMKEYGAASTAIRRFERELGQSKEIQGQLQRLCEMSNVQM